MQNDDLEELEYVIQMYAAREDADGDLVAILRCMQNCISNSRNS